MAEKAKKGEPVETDMVPGVPVHLYPPVHPSNAEQPEHFTLRGQRTDEEWVDPHYAANAAAASAVAAGKEPEWETSAPAPTPGTRFGQNIPTKQEKGQHRPDNASESTTAPEEGK